MKRFWTWSAVVVGILGLTYFVRQFDLPALRTQLAELPPTLILVVPLIGIAITMSTISWAESFPQLSDSHRPTLWHLFWIRLGGEAINNALASAYVAGEPVKGMLAARHGASPAAAYASALIGKTAFICGEVVFLLIGLVFAAFRFGGASPIVTMLVTVTAAGAAVVALGIVLQRRRLVGRGARLLQTLRLGRRAMWERTLPRADAIDQAVHHYYHHQRGRFVIAVLWAAGGWLAGTVEIYLFLALLTPAPDPVVLAIVLESGVAVAKGLSFFVPGSYGAQEGAITWLFVTTGLSPELGVTYAVLRRCREFCWIGLGFASLWYYTRRR